MPSSYYAGEYMSDSIERIHEEPLFRCSSIKKTDDDRKSGGSLTLISGRKRVARKWPRFAETNFMYRAESGR